MPSSQGFQFWVFSTSHPTQGFSPDWGGSRPRLLTPGFFLPGLSSLCADFPFPVHPEHPSVSWPPPLEVTFMVSVADVETLHSDPHPERTGHSASRNVVG